MSRAGRKRKAGKRTSSGKLSQAKAARAARGEKGMLDVVMAQPHRMAVPEKVRKDQKAECELGRLRLRGLISETEYEAGTKWRRLIGEFRQVIAAPMTPVTATSLMVSESASTEVERDRVLEAERPETEEERRERVLDGFNAAQRRLQGLENPKALCAELDAVVVRDLPLASLAMLSEALKALARLWRMPLEEDEDKRRIVIRVSRMERPTSWAVGEVEGVG